MASQYGYGPTAGMSPLALAAENAMVRRNRRLELSALGFAPMTSILPDPSWDAVWGGQDRAQEAANAAGYDYVADNSGLGTMPRRAPVGSLAAGLNHFDRESLGYQSQAENSNAAALEGRFAQLALEEAQRAGKARQDAVEQDKLDRQAADYERFKVESAFQPPIDSTGVLVKRPGESDLATTTQDRRLDPRAVLERQLQYLPVDHPVRQKLEAQLKAQDDAAAKRALDERKVKVDETNAAKQAKPTYEWAQTPEGKTALMTPDEIRAAGAGKPLSAQEALDERKYKKAEPVLRGIAELSEKINTQQGMLAKMGGGAARLAAKANYDDDVAEYQALVSGFTPMVARALGHTGVLTQQDVDSVKALFPAPGDSKTLRDRKMKRVTSIISDLEGATSAPAKPISAASADAGDAGAVEEWVRDPKTGKLVKKGGA